VITVVLVEDQPAVLRALRESLARDPGVRIVGEATSLERGLTVAARLTPDIVVLDAEMKGLDASSAILAVSQRVPETALLVLTLEPDRIAGLGTIDVVGKVDGADALLDAIRAIAGRFSG
jgi:two-component system, NarL family, nitrate/nitrite response regulator NarP